MTCPGCLLYLLTCLRGCGVPKEEEKGIFIRSPCHVYVLGAPNVEAHCYRLISGMVTSRGLNTYKDQEWVLILFPTFKSALSFLFFSSLSLSLSPFSSPFTPSVEVSFTSSLHDAGKFQPIFQSLTWCPLPITFQSPPNPSSQRPSVVPIRSGSRFSVPQLQTTRPLPHSPSTNPPPFTHPSPSFRKHDRKMCSPYFHHPSRFVAQ